MTHLLIELNNGLIEEVSSAVISKLYDIVHSGNLDNTSNLIGRLHTTATYLDYIDYLEDAFKVNGVKLLIIDATNKYMSFADQVVASYWANSTYGDGTGIDIAAINNVLSIPNNAFKDNTSIQTFNELGSFINCTSIGNNSFLNCTALTSINLSNCTSIGESAFNGCTSLTSVDLSNCINLNSNTFKECTSLLHVDFSQLAIVTDNNAFYGCTSLGINETLEINAIRANSTNKNQPSRTFYGTRYKRFIYNAPTIIGVLRAEYTIFDGMTDLEYLDLSNTAITVSSGAVPNTLITRIDSPSTTSIDWAVGIPSQYWIIPSSTMCTVNNDFVRYTNFKTKTTCILYVLDNTVRDAYLADSNWSLITNISDRIKTLAELPNGVWTTGLASQYLTSALLVTS